MYESLTTIYVKMIDPCDKHIKNKILLDICKDDTHTHTHIYICRHITALGLLWAVFLCFMSMPILDMHPWPGLNRILWKLYALQLHCVSFRNLP